MPRGARDGGAAAAVGGELPIIGVGVGHPLSLASGSVLTGHANFFDGWDERKLRTEMS